MEPKRPGMLIVAALFASVTLSTVRGADETAPATSTERPEEFIVTAKGLEDLRLKVRLAEEEAYARFNDINSDDSHDIHCYERTSTGSHVPTRLCVSNAWRQMDIARAQATVQEMQSHAGVPGAGTPSGGDSNQLGSAGYSHVPQQYRANQLRTEKLVFKELGDLANKDPALHEAMLRVGQARQALEAVTSSRAEWTLYRDVSPGDEGLPFGAKRLVEVRVGEVAWNHSLTTHAFTLGNVTGKVRDLRVRCGKLDKKLAYQEDVDWNIPESWSDCALTVNAKRGTTFALYEF